MNIWYVNPYAGGPGLGQAYRPFHLARAWEKLGHRTTIFVASFHHLLMRDALPVGPLEAEGVRYVAVPTRAYTGNGLTRLLNMLDFAKNLSPAFARESNISPPDAIIVSSPHPFAIYAARRHAKQKSARLVFEIRDIWPLSITKLLDVSPWHPFVMAVGHAERYAYRHADLVASLLPQSDQYLAERGYSHIPFVWVPNGVARARANSAEASSPTARSAISRLRTWRSRGRVTLVHAGSMGPPNGLITLLDAVCRPEARAYAEKLAILLIGSGSLEAELRSQARRALCPVDIFGRVPKEDIAPIVREASFGYAGLNPVPILYRFGISLNKLADYLGEGIPVFLPIAPCGDPVSKAKAGLVVEVATPQEMSQALSRLVEIPEGERHQMGERGRQYVRENYDFDLVGRRYVEAIQAVRARTEC